MESDFWLFDHVYGFGPDDVYAVGEAGGKIALWHFDGAAWQTVTTGIELQYPRALWGATPDDLYVVGSHGFIVRGPCE